jgi:hypothetical protein
MLDVVVLFLILEGGKGRGNEKYMENLVYCDII